MFSLGAPAEPYWIDLDQGVRVKVRPLGAALLSAVGARAQRAIRLLMDEHAECLAANMPTGDMPDVMDPDVRHGLVEEAMAVGLARFGILDWEGVGDAAGEALPFTSALAEPFAQTAMGLDFLAKYQAPQLAIVAEGNASAPTPSITSGVGATTAADAPKDVPTAQVT